MNHKYFRRIQFVEILYWTCDIMLDLWCTFVEQEIKKCLFFRPAASHSVRLCTCPPDCRTNGQTAWLAKAVRAMFARPFQVWHLPSTRSPQMPAVPRLVFGLSAQLLSCLSGRQPFLPWTAGCGLLTAASSAFASAGVRGRHSPRLESVSGRCTGYRRRG